MKPKNLNQLTKKEWEIVEEAYTDICTSEGIEAINSMALIIHWLIKQGYGFALQEIEKDLKSQLKPQEGEKEGDVINICNYMGCNGNVVLRKMCETCGQEHPLKQ